MLITINPKLDFKNNHHREFSHPNLFPRTNILFWRTCYTTKTVHDSFCRSHTRARANPQVHLASACLLFDAARSIDHYCKQAVDGHNKY